MLRQGDSEAFIRQQWGIPVHVMSLFPWDVLEEHVKAWKSPSHGRDVLFLGPVRHGMVQLALRQLTTEHWLPVAPDRLGIDITVPSWEVEAPVTINAERPHLPTTLRSSAPLSEEDDPLL
jgi:hypothetical protein